jgi:predicted transcriptional regulator
VWKLFAREQGERTLQEVSVELMRHGIGALVVVDANDDIIGLVSRTRRRDGGRQPWT